MGKQKPIQNQLRAEIKALRTRLAELEQLPSSSPQQSGLGRAELATQSSSAFHDWLIEHVHDAILRTDDQFLITSWNRSAEALYGWKADEVLGRPISEVLQSEFSEEQRALALRTLACEGEYSVEVVQQARDGRRLYVEGHVLALRNAEGQVIGYLSVNRDLTAGKEAEHALERAKSAYADRLQSLSGRLMQIQEEERGHIARELHDEIGQVLTAVRISLYGLRGGVPPSSARLEEAIGTVDRAIEQVRNLSLDLRPSVLDDLGLAAAIRWYADRQTQRAGLILSFSVQSAGFVLPPEVKTACFRIAQEALTNVLRHAHAQRVWIDLRETEEAIRLEVRDDGVGFERKSKSSTGAGTTFGLVGMRERVELLGGELHIESAPDKGTCVRAWVPRQPSGPGFPGSHGG